MQGKPIPPRTERLTIDFYDMKSLMPPQEDGLKYITYDTAPAKPGDPPGKMFSEGKDPRFIAALAAQNPGSHTYELVYTCREPVFAFAEIDQTDTRWPKEQVAAEFERSTTEFWQKHGVNFDLRLELSEACTEKKTSIHAVARAIGARESSILGTYVKSYVSCLNRDKYPSMFKENGECAVDTGNYGNFRSYRMLHMTKMGHDAPLVPMASLKRESSNAIHDHWILYHGGFSMEPDLWLDKPLSEELPQSSRTVVKRPPMAGSDIEERTAASRYFSSKPYLVDLLGGRPVEVAYVTHLENATVYKLDRSMNAVCPQAQRPHKSNHVTIQVMEGRNELRIACTDPDCRAKAMYHTVVDNNVSKMQLYDDMGLDSMHPQEHCIVWDEDYNEPAMRPLPVMPIVCVRAGMGIGKTKALLELLGENSTHSMLATSDCTKVLIVTFSQALAAKMHMEFKHLGFKSYADQTGKIIDSKVVVCLDSLWRVSTCNFDFIILDECVSVFLHFNSPLMSKSSENSMLLELLVRQAKHTYFVDACVDLTFMKNIVDYFCEAKQVLPHWIRNRHVRASNRVCYLREDGNAAPIAMQEHHLMLDACEKVHSMLMAGKRVVVSSSTKAFTTALHAYIAEKRAETRVLLYNSTTKGAIDNVNELWLSCDLLIYSPSITAGVSFEKEHFDCLVAYIVNTPHAPSVDMVLQQLFRVRNLTDGGMYLFVSDKGSKDLPYTDEQIDTLLNGQHTFLSDEYTTASLNFSAHQRIMNGAIVYDRDRLSYRIIKGIIAMRNRSAMNFTDLLGLTLRDDYGITMKGVPRPKKHDKREPDMEILLTHTGTRDPPPFSKLPELDRDMYCRVTHSMETATDLEKAAKKLYDYRESLYGVPEDVNMEKFYKQLVAPKNSGEMYQRAKRYRMLCHNTLEVNKSLFNIKMSSIVTMTPDRNLDLYKAKFKAHYMMLIHGQRILESLLDGDSLQEVKSLGEAQVQEDDVVRVMDEQFESMAPEKKAKFYKLFGVVNDEATHFALFKRVIEAAFSMSVGRGSTSTKRKAYTVLTISNPTMAGIQEAFKPSFPSVDM
jgi:Origin of replication binding protein